MDGELAEISVWQLSTDGSADLGAIPPVTERGDSLRNISTPAAAGTQRHAHERVIRPETIAFLRQLDIPIFAAKSSAHAPSSRGSNQEELEINLNAALELLLHMIDAAKSLEDINSTIPSQFEFLSGGLFRYCCEAFNVASSRLLEYLFTAPADIEVGAQDLFDIVVDRVLKARPDLISSPFHDPVNNGQSTSILHLAVARPHVREQTVLSLLEMCPRLAHAIDDEGTVALHRATGNATCSMEVIKLLLKADPDGIKKIDGEGYVPLHWAVNAEPCRPEVVDFLLNACPETCSVACDQGTIPLHWAVDRSDPNMDVVYALAKAFPKGLKRRCSAGNVPVHRCVDRSNISMECLEWLVSKYPKSLEMANNDGQLPLHRLVDRSDLDLTALSYLIEVYPGALSTPDIEGYLPIHIALDTDVPHVAGVLALLLKSPETASMKNNDGMLPFHFALNAKKPSIELVEALLSAYPQAASKYAVDIIPEEESADPLNWTGSWKKRKWMPLDRARQRGLNDIAEVILSTLGSIGPADQAHHPSENRRSAGKDDAVRGRDSVRNDDKVGYSDKSTVSVSSSSLPSLAQPQAKLSDRANDLGYERRFDDSMDKSAGTLPAIPKPSEASSSLIYKSSNGQSKKSATTAQVQLYFEDDRDYRSSYNNAPQRPIIRYKRRDHGHSRGRSHRKDKYPEVSDPNAPSDNVPEEKRVSSAHRARSSSRRKRTHGDRGRNIRRQVRELEALKASLDERASSLLELEHQLRSSLESMRVGSPTTDISAVANSNTSAATAAVAPAAIASPSAAADAETAAYASDAAAPVIFAETGNTRSAFEDRAAAVPPPSDNVMPEAAPSNMQSDCIG